MREIIVTPRNVRHFLKRMGWLRFDVQRAGRVVRVIVGPRYDMALAYREIQEAIA